MRQRREHENGNKREHEGAKKRGNLTNFISPYRVLVSPSVFAAVLTGLFLLLASAAHAFDSVQFKKNIAAPAGVKNFAPESVAFDASGRLWVTDAVNDTVDLFSP